MSCKSYLMKSRNSSGQIRSELIPRNQNQTRNDYMICYICEADCPKAYLVPYSLNKVHMWVYVCKDCSNKLNEAEKERQIHDMSVL